MLREGDSGREAQRLAALSHLLVVSEDVTRQVHHPLLQIGRAVVVTRTLDAFQVGRAGAERLVLGEVALLDQLRRGGRYDKIVPDQAQTLREGPLFKNSSIYFTILFFSLKQNFIVQILSQPSVQLAEPSSAAVVNCF